MVGPRCMVTEGMRPKVGRNYIPCISSVLSSLQMDSYTGTFDIAELVYGTFTDGHFKAETLTS